MKNIITLLLLIIIGVFGVAYWQWNKPRETASNKKVEVIISIDSLYAAFQANDSLAFSTYQNKVVQISGLLDRVEKQGEGANQSNFAVLLSKTNGIEAKFSFPDTASNKLLTDLVKKQVVLKGFFAGFNYDAMMPEMGGTFEFNQSAIIQNKTHE
jgi:uncharacterized protein YfaA (DUF2138 family)